MKPWTCAAGRDSGTTAGETAFKQKEEYLDCIFIFFTDTLLPTALTAKVMFVSACCGVIG